MRMEKWIFDSPDQAGEAFRQFVHWFYQQNRLVTGDLEIGGHAVSLRQVTCPVLNIYATYDHLVPPESSKALERHVGTRDYTSIEFKGGHIGIYVSGRAQHDIPPAIAEWLQERSD
jgi:polyhydroxyalkanoate synthase